MYIPKSFLEEDLPRLHSLMQAHNFAVMFSQFGDEPFATHMPFMLDASRGEYGTLITHMARANPHWKMLNETTSVLVVFQGPHDYISPSWYVEQEAVPTWNYAAVHVYGKPKLIHEPTELHKLVADLVDYHEPGESIRYDATLMESKLKAIVGMEIPIERIEGKLKFNQNRSEDDQRAVMTRMETQNPGVAAIMRQNLETKHHVD